jgi:hypothetical protein
MSSLDRAPPLRSLEEYHAELIARFRSTPQAQAAARGELENRIRAVETEINARSRS